MTGMAVEVGADKSAFEKCVNGPEARAALTASIAGGNELKYISTPTFRFLWNGDQNTHELAGAYPMARFDEILAAIAEGKEIPVEAPPKPPELPRWAKPEGQAPDPAHPGHTVMGDAYKGSPQARVTVVEFSDFECPACAKHALEAQPQIDAALVDTGKVRWISKHLPLRMHPHAALAAAAAECASDQNKYWPMHDALYRRQSEWATDEAATVLPQIARDAGLNGDAFDRCFDSRRGLERVLADMYDAQGIVERTPGFVILPGDGTGTLSNGMPADAFIKFLNDLVEGQKAAAKN
jgi:protein-disulfide isomerase